MVWKSLLIGLLVWAAAVGMTEVFDEDEAPSNPDAVVSQRPVRAQPRRHAARRAVPPPRAQAAPTAAGERFVDERDLQPDAAPEPEGYFTQDVVPEVSADTPSFEGGMGLRDSADGAPLEADDLVFPDDGAGGE